jgi:hypothetical protein
MLKFKDIIFFNFTNYFLLKCKDQESFLKGRNVSPKYRENISTQGDIYHDIPASILPKSRPYILEVKSF